MSIGGWPSARGLLTLVLRLPISGLVGCESRPAQQVDTRAADVAALRELHDQLTAAQNAGDASVFERTSATDVLVLPPDGGLIAGRQAHVDSIENSSTRLRTFSTTSPKKSSSAVIGVLIGAHIGIPRRPEREVPQLSGRATISGSRDANPTESGATPASFGTLSHPR